MKLDFSISVYSLFSLVLIKSVKSISEQRHCEHQSTELSNVLINIPRCVIPVEELLQGRSRSGVGGGLEMETPPWFNATLATLGQKYIKRNWFTVNLSMMISELVITFIPDIANIIYRFTENMDSVIKRFTINSLQRSVWFKDDLSSNYQNIHDSLTKVKSMHLVALYDGKHGNTNKSKEFGITEEIWAALEADLLHSNIRRRSLSPEAKEYTPFEINQYSMAMTLWGLAAMPIIRAREFGIAKATEEEMEGFLHFWAFIGHGIGVEDEFNVCLQPSLKEAKVYFNEVLNEIIVPYMFNLQYESKVLVEYGARAFTNRIGPIAQFEFFLRRVLEDVVRIPVPNLVKVMSPMSRTLDTLYRRVVKPAVYYTIPGRATGNLVYDGLIQNLSKRVFGFDGTNKTIVAERAFSW